jgi:hypothetical protein
MPGFFIYGLRGASYEWLVFLPCLVLFSFDFFSAEKEERRGLAEMDYSYELCVMSYEYNTNN